jgi:hypothetical protein
MHGGNLGREVARQKKGARKFYRKSGRLGSLNFDRGDRSCYNSGHREQRRGRKAEWGKDGDKQAGKRAERKAQGQHCFQNTSRQGQCMHSQMDAIAVGDCYGRGYRVIEN